MFVIQAAGDLYKKNKKKHRIQATIIYSKIEKIQKGNTIHCENTRHYNQMQKKTKIHSENTRHYNQMQKYKQ